MLLIFCLTHTFTIPIFPTFFILLIVVSLRVWPASVSVCSPSSFPNTKKSRDSRERSISLRTYRRMLGILSIATYTGSIRVWSGRLRKSRRTKVASILPEEWIWKFWAFFPYSIPCFPRLLEQGKEPNYTFNTLQCYCLPGEYEDLSV